MKVVPASLTLDEQIKQVLHDYGNLVDLFIKKKPYKLTNKFCNQHKSIHIKFHLLMEKVLEEKNLYRVQFETIHTDFTDKLIILYEENEMTIDEELRKTEQIKKMFHL